MAYDAEARVVRRQAAGPASSRLLRGSALLERVARVFEIRGAQLFRTIRDIERPDTDSIRAEPVKGTLLETVAETLQDDGILPLHKNHTLGDIADGLGVTIEQLHTVACHCHHGDSINGHHVAYLFRELSEKVT